MAGDTWNDSGDAWQQLIVSLLQRRYGPFFQEIPDRDQGDCGLEGYTSSDGVAYQCYAAEEPLSTNDLYEKQRDKITRDIGKFIANEKALSAILGTTRIRVWMLVVPRFESAKLLQHATKKAEEVRLKGLSYAHPDFEIRICNADPWKMEREELLNLGLQSIEVQPRAIGDYTPDDPQLVENLDRKVKAVLGSENPANIETLKRNFLRNYVLSEDILAQLNSDYPVLYSQFRRAKEEKERHLETESLLSEDTPSKHYRLTLEDFTVNLSKRLGGLSSGTIQTLGHGTLAGWLMHCPLDFPNSNK